MATIRIPVELSFTTVNESAAALINAHHANTGEPSVQVGDENPYNKLLIDIVYGGNNFVRSGPIAESTNIEYTEILTIPVIQTIVGLGGDISGLPVFFVIANKLAECPFSSETPKENWEVWNSAHHNIQQYGSTHYRASTVGQSGEPMLASYWLSVSPYNVISLADYKAIQQQFQTP